jgi:spore maturation protein CgeB
VRTIWLGLSITSSWGNGHATNYRGLLAALRARGHEVRFLERDVPWYASDRDFTPPWVGLYRTLDELERWQNEIRGADLVVVGSFVPEGRAVAEWVLAEARGVTAFWDIDTPVTAARLARGDHEYLSPELVPRFDLYLSFTGGPLLEQLGARRPTPFYCSADPAVYRPLEERTRWELGYLGTYSDDRQPKVDRLLLEPACRLPAQAFAVAGPQYPDSIDWPPNVERLGSLPPPEHPAFYARQRFTLNVTRAEMVHAGWSPSVRLFEAAACGLPVISDWWAGLDAFFEPGHEILIAEDTEEVLRHLRHGDAAVGHRARERVLASHTPGHRARELEQHVARVREEVHA